MRELLGATLEQTDRMVIVDMEASVEHMRRATVRHVDTLLVVAEPYYRALEAARRLIELARELGIERILAVANKVRSEKEEQAIRGFLDRLDVPLAQVVPFDPAVGEADLEGRSLLDHRPEAESVAAIRALADRLVA